MVAVAGNHLHSRGIQRSKQGRTWYQLNSLCIQFNSPVVEGTVPVGDTGSAVDSFRPGADNRALGKPLLEVDTRHHHTAAGYSDLKSVEMGAS